MEINNNGGLKKHSIGIIGAVGLIYSLAAAGAYGIEEMIPSSGPGLTIILLVILPIIWGLPQALMVSELGSALPLEGGAYRWVQHALGEFWAFQFGWCRSLGNYIGTPAFVVLASDYAASILGLDNLQQYILAIVLTVIIVYINIRGIKEVSVINTAISVLILIAFGAVTVIGFMNWNVNPIDPIIPEGQGVTSSLGLGLAIGMWMYYGFYAMSAVAGELEDPQVIPKALMISVPLISLTYILPTLAGLCSVGQWQDWGTSGISYANIALSFGVPWLGAAFVLVAFISQLSMYNAYTATSPREFYVLSEDNLGPKIFAKISPKYGTPKNAILLMGVVSILACNLDFSALAVITVLCFLLCNVLLSISAMILRIREPEMNRPFKVPLGNKMFCVMCIVPIIICFLALYLNGTDYFVFGLAAMASGIVMYVLMKRIFGGLNKIDAEKYPLNPKTKLAVGDLKRIATLLIILAIVGIIGIFFLPWYDAPDYYESIYGVKGIFDMFISGIKGVSVTFAVIAIVLWIAGRKIDRH